MHVCTSPIALSDWKSVWENDLLPIYTKHTVTERREDKNLYKNNSFVVVTTTLLFAAMTHKYT